MPTAPDPDALLPYGLSADGRRLLHVAEVPSGLACGCCCPRCGTPLVARKGEVVAHHFAHHADRVCGGAWETTLHRLAKELLAEASEILLPEAVAEAGGTRRRVAAAQAFRYDAAEIEVDMGGLRPDAVVHRGALALLVEFHVTHPCEAEKVGELRRRALPCIEVDLSRTPRHAPREAHAEHVLRAAPRRWLYNAKIAAAAEHLRSAAEERAAAERTRRARWHAGVAEAVETAWPEPPRPGDPGWARWARDAGLGGLVGVPVAGHEVFALDLVTWQAMVLHFGLARASGRGFDAERALRVLREQGALKAPFSGGRAWDAELVGRVRERVEGFRPPGEVVAAYAAHLVRAGVLDSTREGGWEAGHQRAWAVRERLAAAEAARAREGAILARVTPLLEAACAAVPPLDWMRRLLPELGAAPTEIARAGGPSYDGLLQRLDLLARMVRPGGDPARVGLLGLPLEAVNRAREEEARRREEERRRRLEEAERQASARFLLSVTQDAAALMGEREAQGWLAAVLADAPRDEQQPEGSDGDRVLRQADRDRIRQALERERRRLEAERLEESRRRDAESQAARLAARCREQLGAAARSRMASERAALWLHTTQPRLGRTPWLYCTDDTTLAACLRLLEGGGQTRATRRR